MKNWVNKLDLLLGGDDSEMLSKNRYKQTEENEQHELRRGKKRVSESPVRLWKNKVR